MERDKPKEVGAAVVEEGGAPNVVVVEAGAAPKDVIDGVDVKEVVPNEVPAYARGFLNQRTRSHRQHSHTK